MIYKIIAKITERREITNIKVQLLAAKEAIMDEFLPIEQWLKHAEEMKCTDEIEHLRNKNNSKSTIINILLENLSILANATYKHSQTQLLLLRTMIKIPLKFLLKSRNERSMLAMSKLEMQKI